MVLKLDPPVTADNEFLTDITVKILKPGAHGQTGYGFQWPSEFPEWIQ